MSVTVAPSNIAQAQAWDGAEGSYWATHHDAFERCLADYQPAVLDAARIAPGDRVLDIGCGTGATSRAAARLAPQGAVLGVDLSAEMLQVGRRLATEERLTNLSYLQADAQVHPFPEASFDVLVSQTGAMFFGEPATAFARLAGALRPRGRLVLLTWRDAHLQEWMQAFTEALTSHPLPAPPPGTPGPFSLSDPDHVRELLGGAGFRDVALAPLEERTCYGRTVEEALDLLMGLLGWMLADQGPERRRRSADALRGSLSAHLDDRGVRYRSAAWLVTATAS